MSIAAFEHLDDISMWSVTVGYGVLTVAYVPSPSCGAHVSSMISPLSSRTYLLQLLERTRVSSIHIARPSPGSRSVPGNRPFSRLRTRRLLRRQSLRSSPMLKQHTARTDDPLDNLLICGSLCLSGSSRSLRRRSLRRGCGSRGGSGS